MAYKAALIVLYDIQGRFLLQHRSEDAEVLPGYWAFFGGGVKRHEPLEDALHREALEELSYSLKSPLLFKEQNFKVRNATGRMYVFIDYFNGNSLKLRLREGQGWGWFNIEEIDSLKMIAHDRRILKSISRYVRKNKCRVKTSKKD